MSKYQLSAVTLLVTAARREVEVHDFSGDAHAAAETPALVVGPEGLLLEVAHRRWHGGGHVVCLSRGDSPPEYDRLMHGVRLGVQARDDGTDSCEAGLLRWDPAGRWGNVSKALMEELDDVLGETFSDRLVEVGALAVGSREDVLGDTGRRRHYVVATTPADDPVVPLAVYVVTRVLPVATAMARGGT